MVWSLPALLAAAVLLWVDGIAGGSMAGKPVAVLIMAALAVAAGLWARALPLAVTAIASTVLVVLGDQAGSAGRFSMANDMVFYAVVVPAPALVGWLIGQRRRRAAALRKQTAELERRRADASAAARAAEVERIERQVDRALAERLVTIITGIRESSRLAAVSAQAVPACLHAVEGTARGALEELRAVLETISTVGDPTPAPASGDQPPAGLRRWPDLVLSLAGVPLAVETGPSWIDVVLALLQGPALCVVRRRPLLGTLPLMGLALVQTRWFAPLPPTVSWFLPGLLLAFLVGLRLPGRRIALGLLVLAAELSALTLATPSAARSLDGLIPSSVMAALACGAGWLVRDAEQRATELQQTLAELERTGDASARLAAAESRAEMARELHDAGAHTLTVVCLQAGAVQALWDRDPAQARHALGALLSLADGALGQLTGSLSGLAAQASDPPLDPSALQVLVGAARALGLDVTLETIGRVQPLVGEPAQAAFRLVQESLTNAARHAPGARVLVRLAYADEALEVIVRDFGASSPPGKALPGSGRGLQGMRERVFAVDGSLEVGALGEGFAVRATIPLQRPSAVARPRRLLQRVLA